ncbi:MAG: gamma-glutamyl-gamma-aminobutyrate hydrolase family protein, partial [Paenibacillus sp.]|uniref:gamma-glutamyl-gamma-aminobutyrate hydrolase family protein n=1 Tax=Paenibacillus sp. TaxID=58172 RepID=UPI002900FC4D
LYGQEKLPLCQTTSACRDSLEKRLFEKTLQYEKPVLGICRGFQFMNVMLGGSLYQDIKSQTNPSSPLVHSQGKPYEAPAHSVKLYRDTPIYHLAGQDEIMVNSLHHQAVHRLADRLTPAAVAPDGIIEAAYMPDVTFVVGVQWHPEYRFEQDPVSARLFKAFVDSCRL